MKIAGILMILISTTAIGFRASECMGIRLGELSLLRKMMILFRGEVMYHMASVSEAMKSVSEKIEPPFSKLLYETAEELERKDGRTFSDVWSLKVKDLKKTCLSAKDTERLRKFGEDFGYMQKEMQLSAFDLYIEELEQSIREVDKKKDDNSRLYKSLGIMGGILIVIVII